MTSCRLAALTAAMALWSAPAAAQVIFVFPGSDRPKVPLESLIAQARRDSLDPLAHYQLGLAQLVSRHHDSADAELRLAIRLDPRMAGAHLALAVAEDENDRYWSALRRRGGDTAVARERAARDALLRRAYLLDPLVDQQVLIYGDRRRFGFDRGPRFWDPDLFWQFANADEQALLRRGTVADSLPPGLLWFHGLMSAHTGRYQHATRDLTLLVRALAAHERGDSLRQVPLPTNDVRYVLAVVQQRGGNRAQAIALLREVIENDVGNYMAQVQLARLHEDGQEWSQAVHARQDAIVANPDDPTLQLDLAATLLNSRRARAADSVLTQVAPRLTSTPRLYYLTGLTKQELAQNEDARAAFEAFLRLAPSHYGAAAEDARRRLATLAGGP